MNKTFLLFYSPEPRSHWGLSQNCTNSVFYVTCRAAISAEPFDSVCISSNRRSFEFCFLPVDQLNKHAEKKNKKINPDFSGGNDNHA